VFFLAFDNSDRNCFGNVFNISTAVYAVSNMCAVLAILFVKAHFL